MKYILPAITILFCLNIKAQTFTTQGIVVRDWLSSENFASSANLLYKYDTSVLYQGDLKCDHSFAEQKKPLSNQVCAVAHGPEGCPDMWYSNKQICTKCLRHIYIRETVTVIPRKDEYQEALDKLNKILHQ